MNLRIILPLVFVLGMLIVDYFIYLMGCLTFKKVTKKSSFLIAVILVFVNIFISILAPLYFPILDNEKTYFWSLIFSVVITGLLLLYIVFTPIKNHPLYERTFKRDRR